MDTGQISVTLCGWAVKTGMAHSMCKMSVYVISYVHRESKKGDTLTMAITLSIRVYVHENCKFLIFKFSKVVQ